MSGSARDDEGAEALRRRLYLPGATEQDLAQFQAASAAAERPAPPTAREASPVDPAQPGPQAAAPGRRLHSRRLVLIGGGVLAVAAAGTVVAAGLLGQRPVAAGPAGTSLRLSADDREELLANLRRGGDAGIGAYLVTHRSPPALRSATRVFTVEQHGTGRGGTALAAPDVGGEAGRATVLVTASEAGPVSWTAFRLGTAGSPAVRLLPLLARSGDQAAGDLTTASVPYAAGRRPVRLEVDVPAGVRWGAAVVYSD